jgi:hypothetical protein
MFGMLITEGAVLFIFNPFRMQPLILRQIVVTVFTFAASQCDFISGHSKILSKLIFTL